MGGREPMPRVRGLAGDGWGDDDSQEPKVLTSTWPNLCPWQKGGCSSSGFPPPERELHGNINSRGKRNSYLSLDGVLFACVTYK